MPKESAVRFNFREEASIGPLHLAIALDPKNVLDVESDVVRGAHGTDKIGVKLIEFLTTGLQHRHLLETKTAVLAVQRMDCLVVVQVFLYEIDGLLHVS